MKFSYNWLKEYIDIKETPEKLAEILTMHAFEAEGVEKMGKGFEKVVVAEVLGVKKHPNANRLNLATIDTGSGVLEIVCGASNVAKGQKVAVALAGAKLLGGMEISEREVRGIKSQGMICAEDELGIGSSHEGIMVLPPETPCGMSFAKFLKMEDSIIDFSILPDRAHDALSYWGLSQEIAAVLGRKLTKGIYNEYQFHFKEDKDSNIKNLLTVDIEDDKLCRRYSAKIAKNVAVSDSPRWIQEKLKLSGIRPINNLVDISNLVMLETGQPLHIFDLDKIDGVKMKKIIIRRAKKSEKILALDGKEYALSENNLVIADNKKSLAVAGIMGGEFSGVGKNTKNIVIEAANFDPINIRQSSKSLGLASDSSYRFEREIDRNLTILALKRASELVQEISGGAISKGIIDIYAAKTRPRKIKLSFPDVKKLLGAEISYQKIAGYLITLGFGVKKSKSKILEITVPTRRLDITNSTEIIREIARLYGYDNIAAVKPKVTLDLPKANFNIIYQNKIKKFLAAQGFSEVYNYSFIGDRELKNIGSGSEHYLELANPLNSEQQYLRLSLVPSMLKNIADNSKIFAEEKMKIFEIGKVYFKNYMGNNSCLLEKSAVNGVAGSGEKFMLSGAICDKTAKNLFYDIKNITEILFNYVKIKNISYAADLKQCPHLPVWHMGRVALIAVEGSVIGVVGEISPGILKNFKISGRVGVLNIDLHKIISVAREQKHSFKPISKFPSVKIDLAILIPKKVLWSSIRDLIYKECGEIVREIELFDIYEGKNIPLDKKSLAFHLIYQSNEKTLKDEDIKGITGKIVNVLKANFGANLRN